jgi:hypothetical protein
MIGSLRFDPAGVSVMKRAVVETANIFHLFAPFCSLWIPDMALPGFDASEIEGKVSGRVGEDIRKGYAPL